MYLIFPLELKKYTSFYLIKHKKGPVFVANQPFR